MASRNPDVVEEGVIGQSRLGQPIMAYKIDATSPSATPDGPAPAVLYDSTQHAREWIATEVERRAVPVRARPTSATRRRHEAPAHRELWFVPVVNPDGYDYTFVSAATACGARTCTTTTATGRSPTLDGVDTNRNFPTKWNYDLEGASDDPPTRPTTARAPAPSPRSRRSRGLERRVHPKFLLDYHSFARLILYPEGWQVETPATDRRCSTDARRQPPTDPAIPGFDPEVSAQLYTTNGDITDDAYTGSASLPYTVELDGGAGAGVGGTDGSDPNSTPRAASSSRTPRPPCRRSSRRTCAFALDLARSAGDPAEPVSHLGNTAPDLVPDDLPASYGTPQTVEVNAKRSAGKVSVHWAVNGGEEHRTRTREFDGGTRYGDPGVYYHRLRAQISGTKPGDKVKVWFEARHGDDSRPFTYTVKSQTGNPVLLMVAEDYTGRSALQGDGTPYGTAPLYRDDYARRPARGGHRLRRL